MRHGVLFGAAAIVAGLLAVGAASAQIYDQKYVVEAVIKPLIEGHPIITVAENWETVVYRDPIRFDTVVRVFGEALHFEFQGEDYFLLKRGVNGSSAGAFDPLRECFGIRYTSEYENAPELTGDCHITERTLMVAKADADGNIERLARPSSKHPYLEFEVELTIRPTSESPSYELLAEFPWISELKPYEPSVLPTTIPEEGTFVPARHYQKDFVVRN